MLIPPIACVYPPRGQINHLRSWTVQCGGKNPTTTATIASLGWEYIGPRRAEIIGLLVNNCDGDRYDSATAV
jgi:hypothetical protein